MAGYDNIKDYGFDKRTAEERRELAIKAGKASGEIRRKKANFRKTLNQLLTTEIDNEEWKPILESLGLECTLESAMLAAQIKAAMEGNTKAAYFIAQYSGQDPKSDVDQEEQRVRIKRLETEVEKIKRDVGNEEGEEGVVIINDAPKETNQDI